MKKVLICLSICIFIFAAISKTYAADSFTFSEKLTEKVKKYTEDGDSWWELLEAVKYSIAAKVSTKGIDISKITDGTYVSIEFGDFYFEGDISVKTGKKNTVLYDEDECNKMTLKWDKNYLTISIASLCTEGEIFTGYYEDEIGTGKINDSDEAYIHLENQFLDIGATFDVKITGKAIEKIVIKDGEEFYVNNISVKGKGVRIE